MNTRKIVAPVILEIEARKTAAPAVGGEALLPINIVGSPASEAIVIKVDERVGT